MHLSPIFHYFIKNNARHINHMTVLIFPKNLDLSKNAYSQIASLYLDDSEALYFLRILKKYVILPRCNLLHIHYF